MILVFAAPRPASAWLTNRVWYPGDTIQAEWLFPVEQTVTVSVTGGSIQGFLALRVWAVDRDYWEADDVSHALPTKRRMGYEYDSLKVTFRCQLGTFGSFYGTGGQQVMTVDLESGGQAMTYWWSVKPNGMSLMPWDPLDEVTVEIDDPNSLRYNDSSQTVPKKYIDVVFNQTTKDIVISGDLMDTTGGGGPATSGWNYPSPSQTAYLYVRPLQILAQMIVTTAFGSATGTSWVLIPIPKDQQHGMYTVTVTTLNATKSANYGLFFHHDCAYWSWSNPPYDEVTGGWDNDPNWFQGFSGPEPPDRHWNDYIGANPQGVRYHWNIPAWPQGYTIGVLDIHGDLGGPRGTCYIGEVPDVPDNANTPWTEWCRFYEGVVTGWSFSNLWGVDWNGNAQIDESEKDVLTYHGMDLAGTTVKHEVEHKSFWENTPGNWGPDYSDEDIARAFSGDPGYDSDGDGVADDCEIAKGPPWDEWDAYSLLKAHSGIDFARWYPDWLKELYGPPPPLPVGCPDMYDIEFEAEWWGGRLWQMDRWVAEDWSDHGAQQQRH